MTIRRHAKSQADDSSSSPGILGATLSKAPRRQTTWTGIALFFLALLQLWNSKLDLDTDYLKSWVDTSPSDALKTTSTTVDATLSDPPLPGSPPCLPVFILPGKDHEEAKGEHKHFVVDGIAKSPYLTITNDPTEGNIWVIDQIRSLGAGGCKEVIEKELQQAMDERRQKYQGQLGAPLPEEWRAAGANLPRLDFNESEWTVIHNDWSDGVGHFKCKEIQKFREHMAVRWAVRSTVRRGKIQRSFQDEPPSQYPGWRAKAILQNWSIDDDSMIRLESTDANEIIHIPYHVRSDHVHALSQALRSKKDVNHTLPFPSKDWDPNALPRPIDVCHFWNNNWHDKERPYNSELRDLVSHTLEQIQNRPDLNLTTMLQVKGTLGASGRLNPQHRYAEQLLDCKIVVATQRDFHEDQYRLMEALASGAMVLSDIMIRPPQGFVGGENIDFFQNRQQLEDKLKYYIRGNPTHRKQVAKQGWILAMTKYRSWHFMEKLVFGTPISEGIEEPIIDPLKCP